MREVMKRGLILYALMIMVIFTGCESNIEPDSLRSEDFEQIESICLQKAKGYLGEFSYTAAQFFFKNSDAYSAENYMIEEINVVKRVYAFKNEDGVYCLALPFEALVSCNASSEKAPMWNFIVLVNPTWEEDMLNVQSYQLWKSRFSIAYASNLFSSVQEAMEWEFEHENQNAEIYEYS